MISGRYMYETHSDGRQKAATVLETWDLQAMHALNSGEVACLVGN